MSPEALRRYLEYYQDLGIKSLYRRAPAREIPVSGRSAAAREIQTANSPPITEIPRGALISLEDIRAELGADCTRCKLHRERTQVVFGVGDPGAKLVFVGEGPGADEDAQGIPFIGRAGQLLTQMIENTAKREGIPLLRKDVYICNVVKCRPPGNRTPEPDEMETCAPFLYRQIEAIRPKAICALGGTAVKGLLKRSEGVTKLRGRWHEWRGIPVMVTYHPSYLLRPYNQDAKREAWEDLKKVLHFVYD
jgi:uracil-DNA glycosylase family 4